MPFGDVTIPLLDGEKGGWKLRETFATSVGAAIVAILATFAVLVEYPEPAAVSDDHVAKYYLYYFQVTAVEIEPPHFQQCCVTRSHTVRTLPSRCTAKY